MTDPNAAKSLFGLLQGLRGWRPSHAASDVIAGVTLAAITIPEQMATARLGGFEPQVGFYAFVGATLGFVLLGRSKVLTAGADSTITPIFALALAGLAANEALDLSGAAVVLALLVGVFLAAAGALRLGVVASLLSVPVVTGFLGGIAIHIAASQMPIVLGVDIAEGELPARIFDILIAIPQANWISVAIGLSVLVVMLILERINPRVPSALLAIAAATALVQVIGPKTLGIATLGSVSPFPPGFALPPPSTLTALIPLALLLTLVIIMQVSAVDRAFPGDGDTDVNKDFVGVAAGNFLSAAFGAFPINASPPRTAVAVEAGAKSQMGALVAAALVLALAFWGGGLLGSVPNAALAGILLFVAVRLFRLPTLIDIARRAPSEAALALLTFLAIVTLPIQSGIAVGVGLALLHGVWMIAHSPVLELKRLPGTTIWWPDTNGQTEDGVVVLAFQAPLLFANADGFKRQVLAHLGGATAPRLVVLEASAIVEIDYSAARSLQEVIDICHQRGTRFVIARLVSVRASEAIDRFGIASRLGAEGITHSVQEAIDNYQRSGR